MVKYFFPNRNSKQNITRKRKLNNSKCQAHINTQNQVMPCQGEISFFNCISNNDSIEVKNGEALVRNNNNQTLVPMSTEKTLIKSKYKKGKYFIGNIADCTLHHHQGIF